MEVQCMANSTSSSAALINNLCDKIQNSTIFDVEAKDYSNIKRGLRNSDGTGVMAGCTKIGSVQGYAIIDGE